MARVPPVQAPAYGARSQRSRTRLATPTDIAFADAHAGARASAAIRGDEKGYPMSERIAITYDHCGKTVIIRFHNEITNMISLVEDGQNAALVYAREWQQGKGRPVFELTDKHWCPTCLILALTEWLDWSRR